MMCVKISYANIINQAFFFQFAQKSKSIQPTRIGVIPCMKLHQINCFLIHSIKSLLDCASYLVFSYFSWLWNPFSKHLNGFRFGVLIFTDSSNYFTRTIVISHVKCGETSIDISIHIRSSFWKVELLIFFFHISNLP